MDNELQELEAELRRLRPRHPSPELMDRLAGKIETGKVHRLWWTWVALPVAAALTFLFIQAEPAATPTLPGPRPVPVAVKPAPVFKPVAAENVLLAARDEGFVSLSDGRPARRVRQSYVDTIVWKDPRGRASLKWSVPREEERIVPVVFQ
jgi:hypothetical protein